MKQVMVRLTDEQLAKLDDLQIKLSIDSPGVMMTRSDIIRVAIEGLASKVFRKKTNRKAVTS